MWWSRATALALMAALLGGCGFHSLYGSGSSAATAAPELAQIQILPIDDRVGQLVRNDLIDMFNTDQKADRIRYQLKIILSENTGLLAVQKDQLATRANYRLTANYVLSVEGKPIYSSVQSAISSYNVSSADFTTLTATQDSKERAAREIAIAIRTNLSVYFSKARQ
jgi:LPS-assembly lipoprotein